MPSWAYHLELALERFREKHKFNFGSEEQKKFHMELTEQEVRDIRKIGDELKAEQETNERIRKLVASMISDLRQLALEHEDLMKRCYDKASKFENLLRTL
jgi:DNA anti-recombination protein RmuC